MGRGKLLVYTVAAALALSACASKKPKMPKPAAETISRKMTSKWKGGTCVFDSKKMTITYSDSKSEESRTVSLDVKNNQVTKHIELKPKDILCSNDFTVVVGEEYALVAQGADQLFTEFPMLGIKIDDEVSVANSYYLDIRKIAKEKIESVFVAGSALAFITEKKVWEIDLVDGSATSTER